MQDGVVRRMILSVRSERKAKRINIIKNITVFMVTFMLIMIFFYFIRFPNVDGESMNPTYDDKDILVTLHTSMSVETMLLFCGQIFYRNI